MTRHSSDRNAPEKRRKPAFLAIIALAATLALTGCGGEGATGGDGLASPPAPGPPAPAPIAGPKAEGVYAGRTSRGFDLSMLVLENDATWGLYLRNGLVVGFFQGAGFSDNGSFTVDDLREYDFLDQVTRRDALSATYLPRISIQGTLIPTVGIQSSFTAAAQSVIGYDYDRPANLGEIQGRWQGFYDDRFDTGAVDVSPGGGLSAATLLGCRYTGTVAPRASGKNVYDVLITFGAAPCKLAGRSATGIAIIVETVTGTRQLLIAVNDASRELGTGFAGTQ